MTTIIRPRYILTTGPDPKKHEAATNIVKLLPAELRNDFEMQRILFSSGCQSFSLHDTMTEKRWYDYADVMQTLLEIQDPAQRAIRCRRQAVAAEKKQIRSQRTYTVHVYGGDIAKPLDKAMLQLIESMPKGFRSKHFTVVVHDTYVHGPPHIPYVKNKAEVWQLLGAEDYVREILEKARTLPEWEEDGLDTDEEAENLVLSLPESLV